MLFPMELKLMSIVWTHTPLTASHLARLAADQIGWKRTTTYTVVARLAERGVLERQGKLVRPLLSREAYETEAVRTLLGDVFDGDWNRLSAVVQSLAEKSDTANAGDSIDKSMNV